MFVSSVACGGRCSIEFCQGYYCATAFTRVSFTIQMVPLLSLEIRLSFQSNSVFSSKNCIHGLYVTFGIDFTGFDLLQFTLAKLLIHVYFTEILLQHRPFLFPNPYLLTNSKQLFHSTRSRVPAK